VHPHAFKEHRRRRSGRQHGDRTRLAQRGLRRELWFRRCDLGLSRERFGRHRWQRRAARDSGGSGGGDSGGGSAELPPGVTDGPNGERTVCSLVRPDDCYTITPGELIPGFEPTPAAQPVTIRDLISFAPAAPTVTTEPGSWGVRGLHTNVIAGASGHTRSGTLLGQTAEVNFIPVGFTFDYGDGTTVTTRTGGESWASLGLPEFSKTPTSHRYTTVGTKTITAEVEYAAEYRVGDSGWLPVIGTLTIPTDTPHPIQIVRNSTVGVDKPCRPGKPTVGC
jgi:hypothetical protein